MVMCPVHSVPPHRLGPEHLEPDSCGHYPLWFQLLPRARELLAGDAFIRLAFLKEQIVALDVNAAHGSGPR